MHIFSPFSSYNHAKCLLLSLIIRPLVNAPNGPKMTLNDGSSKLHYICRTDTGKSQISLRFALRWLILEIIESLGFSISYNCEFEIFE